ncbi:ArsR family transcriptional regulator [bacterium]|nr:ArsR family transcriptional regulator [bacterium]
MIIIPLMDLETLKALSDENRLRIVMLLADGERCICDLASTLDESDALISHHVKQLREVGLIRTRRVGRWLHCSLEPSAFAALATRIDSVATRATEAAAAPQGEGCACNAPTYPTVKEEIWP